MSNTLSDTTTQERIALAQRIANAYTALPHVEAVALAGSQTLGIADPGSDLDLYVYVQGALALAERHVVATQFADRLELDNQFWEPGDEWIDRATGIGVDVMFRNPAWIEDQLDRVLVRHEGSVGYSTCFWHNTRTALALFDRNGWFAALQQRAEQPYPPELCASIIAKNYPILRRNFSSYRHQLERALAHDDLVSVNHRLAALLASYFDILFALNRVRHPGEKRLVSLATTSCSRIPAGMAEQIHALLQAGAVGDPMVIDALDDLLPQEGVL
jgi:hypothetical protein